MAKSCWSATGSRRAGRTPQTAPTVPIVDSVPDPEALDRLNQNQHCFAFAQRFPGGFTPQFSGKVTDGSMVAGLRGFTSSGLIWDVSTNYGTHQTDFFLQDTVNASLGLESPAEFDPGLLRQEELGLNFDVSYAATDRLNIAAGTEWRHERFEIGAGDPASYEIGPYANQGFTSGSNGFPGFSEAWSGGWNRNSRAVYGDLELRDLDGAWTVGGAVRFEHFDLFGATTKREAFRPLPVRSLHRPARQREQRVPSSNGWTAVCAERADHARLEWESGR